MDAVPSGRALALVALAVGLAATAAVLLTVPSDGDPLVLLRIADPIAHGGVAYRDVTVEYPPLALLPIVMPRVLVGVDAAPVMYSFAFGAVALATTLVCGAAVSWLAARGWSDVDPLDAMLFFLAIAFALTVSIVWRFDILPAALTVLALVALAAGHPAWAGLALGLGIGVKLYPAFLVPVFVAYYAFNGRWRSALMFLAAMGLAAGASMAQVYLFAGSDGFSFLTYQRDRGTEIESVVGGLAMAAHAFFGIPATVQFAFGAFEVESRVVRALAVPDFIGQITLGIVLLAAGVRTALMDLRQFGQVRRRTLVAYIVATLLLVMLANKVLSPQYVVWLLPFAALLPGRQAFLVAVIGVLTSLEYPIAFDALRAIDPLAVIVVNVRNLLLLVLFVWVVVASQRRDVREAADEPEGNAGHQHRRGHPPAP